MSNKFAQVVLGLVWLVASLMLTVYGWTMITDIAELVEGDSVFTVMYWIGIFLMIVVCGLLPAYWLVISAYKTEVL